MRHSLKLLSATALIGASFAATNAHAYEVSSTISTTLITSETTGGIIISSTGFITNTASSTIEFSSGTAADNSVTIATGGALQTGVSATLHAVSATTAPVAIFVSGSVINTAPSGQAVDLRDMTANGSQLYNTGTVSGSITLTSQSDTLGLTQGGQITGNVDLGNGANTAVIDNGHLTGNLTGGINADTITVYNGSAVSGTINAGDGANIVEISNSTVTGNILTGAGTDVITINSSQVTGDISDTDGAGTLTVSNSTITGNLKTGNGASVVTLTNANVTGQISDSTVGGDADVLNIKGTTFTTHGGISGYESLNISATTFNLNHGLTGVSALRNGAGSTFNVANSFTTAVGGTIQNSGTINLLDGKHISTDSFYNRGGELGISILNATTAAGVSATVGNVNLDGGSVTISLATNAGFIASGTQYVIGTGAGGASTSGTLTNPNTGVYRYTTSVVGGNNIILNVGRVSTSSVVQGASNQAIANVLDTLGTGATGNLLAMQSQIGNQANAAGVQQTVESYGPGLDGAAVASVNITQTTGNQVSQRLASIRDTNSGVATGDPMAAQRMWLQGFANHVDQDNNKGASGYTADAAGGSIGLDTDNWFEGVTTGLAVSYGKTNVDSKSTNNASTGINSYVGTLYGSKVFSQGTFINAQLGGGYNDYDMERNVPGIGTAKGSTAGWQATAKMELGHDIAMGQATLTPLASVQYTHLNMDSYTETGLGNAGLHVKPGSMDTADLGAGARLAYGFPLANGGTFSPSLHALYVYRLGDTNLSTSSNFIGGGGLFNTEGVQTDRSSINAGAGMVLTTIGGTDLSLDYDADIRSSLIGHSGQVKARWTF
jgi:outer membrane autotransporter protein